MKIRRATTEDAFAITRIHIETWKTTYRGIISDHFLDNLDYARLDARWRETLSKEDEKRYVFVAEADDGEIVGFASCGPNEGENAEYDSELHAIYVLREFQGKGIGRALFLEAANWLCQQGFKSMIVWVLEQNPARHFYEVLGGAQGGTKKIEIDSALVGGISYGWNDLKSLVESIR